jgi:hypothetical protein
MVIGVGKTLPLVCETHMRIAFIGIRLIAAISTKETLHNISLEKPNYSRKAQAPTTKLKTESTSEP